MPVQKAFSEETLDLKKSAERTEPGACRNGASDIDLASDRLSGVPMIASFWGCTERQARHLIARGLLPVAKHGGLYVASKRVLLDRWRQLTDPDAQNA